MGDWYTVGLALGLGVALGMLFAGAAGGKRGRAGGGGRARRAPQERCRRSWSRTGKSWWAVPRAVCSAPPPSRSSSPARCAAAARAAGLALIVAGVAVGLAGARVRAGRRLPRGGRAARARRAAPPYPGRALRRASEPLPETRKKRHPGRDRRPDAVDARGHARTADRAVAGAPRRARALPPRRVDVSLAHARLPLVARHRRASGRARDPAPRLVPPRRAAARRVRLVVRRRSRGRHEAVARRHDLRAERQPPRRATR